MKLTDDYMEELTYDELMRIHAREKGSKLSAIPENFYELCGKLLSSYNKSDPGGMREYNNALKMIKFIYQRRLEKLFNYVHSYDKELELPPEMLQKERELYEQILPLVKKFSDEIDKQLVCSKNECKEDMPVSILSRKNEKIKLLILKEVEEFVSASGSTIGPFRSQSEIELNPEDAEILIQIGVAKKLEQ